MLRRLPFVFPLALVAAVGCGSIANRNNESVATVSGSLTGPAPAGAHVALVWRSPTDGTWLVSNDAPVVSGAFSMTLDGSPADNLFFDPQDTSRSTTVFNGGSAQPPTASPTVPNGSAGSGGGGSGGSAQIRPKDVASGSISAPLTMAAGGFILYVDANGNGKLDITGPNGETPDTIIGGSHDLMLVYLRDGSNLDLEKLRDDTGQLPSRGYGLVLVTKGRWLPLSSVDLTLGDDKLPDGICYLGPGAVGGGSGGVDVATPSSGPSSGPGSPGSGGPLPPPSGYPAPGDPNLHCSSDGRSFNYSSCTAPPPPPPTPKGLCDMPIAETIPCSGYGEGLASGAPVPPGWPCPIAGAIDGGPPADAGISDGGKGP
jgi:hypothetical protein